MKLITMAIIVTGILLSTMSTPAIADGWNGIGKIDFVVHQQDRIVAVVAATTWTNPDACDSNRTIVLHPDTLTEAAFDETYRLLMSAFLSERSVNLYTSGCTMIDGKTFAVLQDLGVYSISAGQIFNQNH